MDDKKFFDEEDLFDYHGEELCNTLKEKYPEYRIVHYAGTIKIWEIKHRLFGLLNHTPLFPFIYIRNVGKTLIPKDADVNKLNDMCRFIEDGGTTITEVNIT